MLRKTVAAILLVAGTATNVQASEMTLALEVPRLQVAEYHNPYVWVQSKSTGNITNLALWYQIDERGEGEKWLKDLRQWWRRSGRSLEMPVDSFTGATRRPGSYSIDVTEALEALPAGQYTLYIEASREVGGREILKLPATLPAKEPITVKAVGESELGTVALQIKP